jgi:hypothetical protein
MNKKETIDLVNEKIDKLIIGGKEKSKEFKKLCKIHYHLTHD